MTTIFGNPGSTELPMLAEFPDDFSYVLGLQEAVVVGMADGYAQAAGGPTHVNLHTAPGVGNAMGAIFNAQANHSPLLITAGQQVRAADHDAGEPHQPRRDADAAPARQVELRAAAGRGRAARARPRRSTSPRCRRRARRSSRSRWTTGTAEVDEADARQAIARSVERPGGGRPRGGRELAERLDAATNPVLVAGPDDRRQRRLGRRGRARRAPEAAGVGARPRPAAGGSASPRATRTSRACCRRRSGPVAETLEGHDLILVVGSSVFPYYPYIPGPLLPEGADAGRDHQRSRRGGAGADGRRDRRRRRADARAPARGGRRVRAATRADVAARAGARAGVGPDEPATAAMHTLAEVFPDGRDRRPRVAVGTLALRNQLRLSQPGSYYFGAGGGLGFGLAAAVGVQLAQPDRPVVCVLGEGSAQYAVSGVLDARSPTRCRSPSSSCATASTRSSSGSRRSRRSRARRGSTCPALDTAAVADGYGVRSRRVSERDELREALRAAIASDGPSWSRSGWRPGCGSSS